MFTEQCLKLQEEAAGYVGESKRLMMAPTLNGLIFSDHVRLVHYLLNRGASRVCFEILTIDALEAFFGNVVSYIKNYKFVLAIFTKVVLVIANIALTCPHCF